MLTRVDLSYRLSLLIIISVKPTRVKAANEYFLVLTATYFFLTFANNAE